MRMIDPGPMKRFEEGKSDAGLADEVFQRLCEGSTLKVIAKDFGYPKGVFTRWFIEEHRELFDAAEVVLAQDMKHEALAAADGDGDVKRDRLRVSTRLSLMERLDRERYGARAQGAMGSVPVLNIVLLDRPSNEVVERLSDLTSREEVVEGEVLEALKGPI